MARDNTKQRMKKLNRDRRMREQQRKQFLQLKKAEPMRKVKADNVQDTIEVRKVAPNGIFEVGDGLYSRSFLMEDLNYVTKTYDEQVGFFGNWCRILNALEVHSLKITIFNKNRDMEEFRDKILYQHKGDGMDFQRDCYNDIMETKIVDGKNGIKQVKFITFTVKRTNYEDARLGINSIEANLIKEFKAFGSILVPLNANERFRVFHDFYRMGEESEFDINISECIRNGWDWRNEVACNFVDFTEDPSYFRTEKKYGKAMCIDPKSYPDDDISDKLFDEIYNISERSVVSIEYVPISKEATKHVLENKYMSIQDKIRKQQKKRNQNKDFASDISYPVQKENEEIKEMLDDIRDNGQKMFWTSVGIVLMEDTLEKLDAAVDSVNLIVENHGCYTNEFFYRQREALNTILPIGVRQIDLMRSMFTRMCAILIPFKVQEMQMNNRPTYYGTNKESKELILCNRKLLVNGNGFVFGVSGGGKSMTGAKLEMGSTYLTTDDDIIVLDPTHEYRDICDSFNGTFIEISDESDNFINPLDFDVTKLTKHNCKSVISQKSQIMCGICEHAMEKEFKSGHRSIVDRCVKELVRGILKLPVEERKVPIMTDFYNILKAQPDPEKHDIELGLEVFIDGSMDMFNHPTNVNPDNRIIVYGIRDIGEELESVGMLVTLTNIRQRIIRNAAMGRNTWLYVDEFHVLMDKKYSRQFLISLWKKVRKLGGLCTGITQNISDVVSDKETMKLISNSEYTMFLRMGASDGELIVDTFEGLLSEEHLKYINNASPGTGLIRFGNTIIPMDNTIEKDNPIYDIFSTNFNEIAARMKRESVKGS